MAKRRERTDKKAEQLSDDKVVRIALEEMAKAVPEIERRVREREATAMELRFEAPRASDFINRKDEK